LTKEPNLLKENAKEGQGDLKKEDQYEKKQDENDGKKVSI